MPRMIMPTVCFKKTPTKHNKYVVIQKLKHFDDISFQKNSLVEAECFFCFFFTKSDLSLPKTGYLYIRWSFFFMTHSWTNSFNLSFSFELVTVV